MTAARPAIEIAGAGPAGLGAALTIVKRGGRAYVLERRSAVGGRFHGDFQGLENWSVEEASYEAACERRLLSLTRAAAVNRHLFSRIGDRGASALFRRVCEAPDPRAWLRHYYEARWWTTVLFPVARLAAERKRRKSVEHVCQDGCDCTYCRCVREARAERRRDRARESALVEVSV